MNIQNIQDNISKLTKNLNEDNFVYDLLLAYNLPKSTITRLEKGTANLSKIDGEVNLKRKLFFKKVESEDLHLTLFNISNELKHDNRFIIVTDFKTFLAKDVKVNTTLDIHIKDLPKNFDFFLPWAGLEKAQYQNENPADIKAAMKMGKLFDQIKSDNNDNSEEFLKRLNVFLSRLLFCFFAEDSDIFEENMFSNSVGSLTSEDGSDLQELFKNLFDVLNTKEEERGDISNYLNSFPYVNGGLFNEKVEPPRFSKKSRSIIIESGTLSWKDINPDIFGSMFQAVNYANERGTLGQHFTSVVNILKVINPLFMDDLRGELEEARGNNKKLKKLLFRLKNIKVFDPACGSGNFLIIAYKELRRLEMEIFKEMGTLALSEISLSQFYGIEIDEFAKEIAILSLWLSKHQMNKEFFKEFGRTSPTLPLTDAGNIVQDNACRVDWVKVCPKKEDDEIFILGNPPYHGGKLLNSEQKKDTEIVYKGFEKYKNIDYIGCWFWLASKYLNNNIKVGFVTTNSINQGTQVNDLWPKIFNLGVEFEYAEKNFEWSNSAQNNAGVTCSILVLRKISNKKKFIYTDGYKKLCKNINPYLLDSFNVFIEKRTYPLSILPKMIQGNIPLENGFLRMSKDEKNEIVNNYPESEVLFKRAIGSDELINGLERWCLWIDDDKLELANSVPPIMERVSKVYNFRSEGAQNAKATLNRPHQFVMRNTANLSQIIIPIVSSENRKYIPISIADGSCIVLNSALLIKDSPMFVFSILNSTINILWVKAFSGKLASRFRYSVGLCWYSFPFPNISKQREEELTKCSLNILDERLKYSEKTLAELYDPDKMPEGLKEAHYQNDLAVEKCYRGIPFENDNQRLEHLFNLYKKMIEEEKFQNTLFAKEKKTRKRKTT